jgi:penicillin-binding protein 1C
MSDAPTYSTRQGRATRARIAAVLAALCVIVALCGAAFAIKALGPPPLGKELAYSPRVLDRKGKLLRAFATPEGRWRLPATIADVDPRFFDLLFAYEDKRFREHHGVDGLALLRAAWQFASSGHIRSGGSTLTMQVARLLEPRHERSLGAKFRQIVRAVEIERALSKDEVLALYLGLAPYGGNLEGIRGASLAYFGKEPRRLTLGEAALLVALPQSPELRRPDRAGELARAARDRVLDRYAATGAVPADEIAYAKAEPVPSARRAMPMLAPHAADAVAAVKSHADTIKLTIDGDLQRSLEELARERLHTLAAALGGRVSLAMLVVDNASGEVLAHLGSPSYFDGARAGQIDMTAVLRSPGSTLKPFIYGLGFEDGFLHPESLVEDRPVSYGAYAPKDFDSGFKGTVSARQALQLSLNVPAVAVLDRVGASRLAARLTQAGAALVLPSGEVPGLAMGLGGVGITLRDLVMLYGGIARQGTTLPLRELANAASAAPNRLMAPVAAWYVADVLYGSPPPENGVAGRIAFKTGTSYGYRDAWSVGFNEKYTIGVWVGRPDGAPVPGLVGRASAAPILFDAFARTAAVLGRPPGRRHAPPGVLIGSNGALPPPLRHFQPGRLAGDTARPPLHIVFPPDGARLDLTSTDGQPDPVAIKVSGATAPLTVFVNGAPVRQTIGGGLFFTPGGPGFSRVTVVDGSGASDSVVVRAGGTASETAALKPAR